MLTLIQIDFTMVKLIFLDTCIYRTARNVWSFSGPYFPSFGPNTERYEVSPLIQSECGKIQTRETLNTVTLHAHSEYGHSAVI